MFMPGEQPSFLRDVCLALVKWVIASALKAFKTTPRGKSYLWKTTHLNTAERQEDMKEGGRTEGGEGETVAKCEKQRQVLPPPPSSNQPATACLSNSRTLRRRAYFGLKTGRTLTFALS